MKAAREMLLEDGVKERGKGNEDAGTGEPKGGGGTDTAVARLHLVGLHIDNVILLEIVIGGIDQIGVIQVESVDLLLAGGIFTNQFYVGTHTIDGEVASLSQSLKDIDLLIADSEHTRMGHFAEDRNLVV